MLGVFPTRNTNVGVYKNSHFIKVCELYILLTIHNLQLRKVQALQGERSFTIVLPKEFALNLGIEKGDFLKVTLENNKLILQKADI